MVIMLAFGVINLSTDTLATIYGSRIANYLNALVDFQENFQSKLDPFGRRHTTRNFTEHKIFHHFLELNLEFLKILKRQENVDYLRIFISNHTLHNTVRA